MSGRTNYGDSIEDEWVVVYLLRELSKRHKDIWVKVVDSDGEFLLIEAAGTLPAWLEPEVADNRVRASDSEAQLIGSKHTDILIIRYGLTKEIFALSSQSNHPPKKLGRN